MNKELIIDYESLMDSMLKCQRGVRWKPSVKNYIINAPSEILRLTDALNSGSWQNSDPIKIVIPYPKRREGLSIPFKDRVYQRSINDNVLYPEMTKHFVIGNCACQKNKGTKFARDLVKKYLWRHYRNHGNSGYVLQIDIKGYYPNMQHKVVYDQFKRYLSSDVFDMVHDVLSHQYAGEVGYNPGSQMVQIAGISVLNDIDHRIKERYGIKGYIRYMDDFLLIHESKEKLEEVLELVTADLRRLGFEPHPKKTTIKPISKGFTFLGFNYRVTDTGKILMFLNGQNVKHERRKLRRMVAKCKRGEITREKVDECYRSWRAHAAQGTSYTLIRRMDKFYNDLWKEETYGNSESYKPKRAS